MKHRNVTIQPKQKVQGSTRIVNLSGYQTPIVKEVYGKDWVQYGDNNDYFDNLINKYLGSPTNARCINGIIDMIYGRGLEATDSAIKPEMYTKMKMLLKSREIKRVANDYKMLGQAAIQVVYNKQKTSIVKVLHFPMETLRAEKAKDGKINAYFYHPKWADIKPSDNPKRIPTFGCGSKSDQIELYIFKPYRSGFYYYAPVDYNGCLQYCSLEEEVSNYHINNIKNGLQPSLLVNFNNGVPNEETQELIERKIMEKFSGSSNAGKFILTFNESAESQADLTPIHLPDAHAQYQFLADESREKIMLGHGIVSPILLGIKDNTGFGNNAEELRTASILMDNIVIRPFQQSILDGLEEILQFNSIFLNLYFVTLQPIEFTELENISTKVKREEETGEKLSSQDKLDFSDDEGDNLYAQLEEMGETISSDWELVHSEAVTDENEEFDFTALAVTESDSKASARSSQDNSGYKIRYGYGPLRESANSRKFCKQLESLTKKEIVFRKEDISQMSFRGLNKELGHNGANYSLFKFKGGVNCHHFWERKVYKKKVSADTEVEASDAVQDGFNEPTNPKEVPVRPTDMPNRGAYPKTK
tara:strand:- start:62 stop:1828 length:1767 start_codon:yes stop_codon:yes gene_type:complete